MPTQQQLNALKHHAASVGISECKLIGRYPGPAGFDGFFWGGNIF